MNCKNDIEQIAFEKLKDSECLFAQHRFDAAYYLAGYTVELLLKAKVCKTLGIDNFFQDTFLKSLKHPQTFKIHDLRQLLVFSGLFSNWDTEVSTNQEFKKHWSIVCEWSEEARYHAGRSATDAQNFITSVKEVAEWIKKHL